MNKKNKNHFCAVILAALLSGCASHSWMATTGSFACGKHGYSMKTPPGWHQFQTDNELILTRDGPGLECIVVSVFAWGDTFSSKEKVISKNTLLHDLIWTYLTDDAAVGKIYNLQVNSSDVTALDTMVSGRVGYRCRNREGLPIQGVLVCIPLPKSVVFASYRGAQRYYYDRYLPTFEALLRTLSFSPKAKGAINGSFLSRPAAVIPESGK